jgi:hypothetical protein
MPSKSGWHDRGSKSYIDVDIPDTKRARRAERQARIRREVAEKFERVVALATEITEPMRAIPKPTKPKFVSIPQRTFDLDENSPKATPEFITAFKRMHEMFCMGAPSAHTNANCPKCDKTIKGVTYMDGPWRWSSMQRHLIVAHKRQPDDNFVEYVEERYASPPG